MMMIVRGLESNRTFPDLFTSERYREERGDLFRSLPSPFIMARKSTSTRGRESERRDLEGAHKAFSDNSRVTTSASASVLPSL